MEGRVFQLILNNLEAFMLMIELNGLNHIYIDLNNLEAFMLMIELNGLNHIYIDLNNWKLLCL